MHRRRFAAGLAGLVVLMGSAVPQQSFAQSIDYDTDDDGLIEVENLQQLDAIRYDLDGNGSSNADYRMAFPTPATSMGCPATCEGYELMADLDFDVNGDSEITTADGVLSWGAGADAGRGWQPIGTFDNRFTANFNGNGHTISHLFINRPGTNDVGLFGYVVGAISIRNVGLVGVNVTGNINVGGLAGLISGATIRASYAAGEVSGTREVGGLLGLYSGGGVTEEETLHASYATGSVSGDLNVGGLVGTNEGAVINASYATGEVSGNSSVAGLTGQNSVATIRASYATGEASGNAGVGGLVGSEFDSSIHDSYFDTDTFGSTGTEGKTTAQLQSPTSYTGIYANWNVDVDNTDGDDNAETGVDDPWDFGASDEYPVLQVDFDGDGVKSWEEFGPQPRPGVFLSRESLSLVEREMRTYTAVLQIAPTAAVMVRPMSDNPAVSVSVAGDESLTFTPENWRTAQTVTVHAVSDDDGDDETVTLSHTVDGAGNYASVTALDVEVNVEDNNAGIDVSPGTLPLTEGTMESYTVVLLTTPTATVMVTPMSDTPAAVSVVSSGTTFTLTFTGTNWDTPQTVTVSAEEDDNVVGQEVSVDHMVDSDDSNYQSAVLPDVTVNVTDNDTPVFVSTGTLSLTEGTTGSYTVVLLGRPTTPSVTVTPVSSYTTSVRVSGALIFTMDDWHTSQTVMVGAVEDINTASEVVMLTHAVSASPNFGPAPAPVVTVNVTDSGERGIRVRVRVFLEGPLR